MNVFLRLRFPPVHRLSPALATSLFAYDLIQLAALLFLTGGIDNPFMVLLVAPVTVSAATQPPRYTFFLGALAVAASVLLTFHHMPLPWAEPGGFALPPLYQLGMLASLVACLVFLALYAWRLSKEAQQMATALHATELVLAREQRLHALDGLAAAAAHELGTPLATIVLTASELERDVADNPQVAEDIALLRSQATRCREILQKLTRSPQERDPMHARMTPMQIADEAAEPHRDRGVRIVIREAPAAEGRPPPETERRPGVLFGVGNVVENAVAYAESEVLIVARWDETRVELEISDDGPGFPPDVLEQIGDPYVSARRRPRGDDRRQAGGLGLGVFIAKTLVERSGAKLQPRNKPAPARGAVVTITWPRAVFEVADELMETA
jgi:two-component system sensor histidine kinase RegB